MFLYPEKQKSKNIEFPKLLFRTYSHLLKNLKRKAKLSPLKANESKSGTETFFFASLKSKVLKGSMTIEAAIVLPLFLFVMISVLQYAAVMETSVKFGTAMAETGKTMATAAYVKKYGGDTSKVPEIALNVLSAAYAQNKITSEVGETSSVKYVNMLQSSFLQNDETIDLVLSYQIRSPIRIIRLPGNFFLQRARVRAWTGRMGSGGEEVTLDEDSEKEDTVYVTETGRVYHEDPDCTYLSLSIRPVDAGDLNKLRNKSGGKYHTCEKCGSANPSGVVYITNDGNRYHSSLDCSGLKRTVKQVSREELGNRKACSKCGKNH